MLFDLLSIGGEDFAGRPLAERRAALERFYKAQKTDGLLLSPATTSREAALGWLTRSGGALDGVIAKRLDLPYRFGERAMVKVKQQRTADCVVGGFRYAEKKRGGRLAAARPVRRRRAAPPRRLHLGAQGRGPARR